ncbi:4Fe-4S binding domain-containing protein [Lachnospiraceae bacterium KH1T2]|nr:4Fe-4S binding domain-containing protein [Lachnospiraceae bacterium KH1T2]
MKSKKFASVNKDICVSCGACTGECMLGAITTPNGCYAVVDTDKCVGCGRCSMICPTGCISIKDRIGA